jgi:choline dehydrogenase-like flavoprotein
MPICPVQAKYSALKTLNQLLEKGDVEIRTQCVVSRLVVEKKDHKKDDGTRNRNIGYVEYKRYEKPGSHKHTVEKVKGTIIVLAANAIENATLLLASDKNGLANHSGQVGRNLMDHPYLYTWGYTDHRKRVYPFRGPDTTSGMESLRDGEFREVHASFRASLSNWGWSGEPKTQLNDLIQENTYGKRLRHELADRMTRMVKIGFMFEQLPSADNRVTIDHKHKDAMGNYRPVLSYHYDDYSLAGIDTAVQKVWQTITDHAKIVDKTDYKVVTPGYQRVSYNGNNYNIMGSGHIVGTHRMGSSPEDSVTDKNMKTWDHPNLYVVGPGNQVTIGTANPTLTTAALAIRAAEAILKEL